MQVYTVRDITSYLRELFESNPHLGDLWIAGEVSNVSRPSSGHVYFTLKDSDAQLRAVFFARRTAPSSATAELLENGRAVVAHGRIALYEQRGDLQLIVDFVQPEGVGALSAEYERLKARLEEEGLFDESRKRQLPRFPVRIGVVTSDSGAVFHDVCHVLKRRWPVAEIVLSPTPVQGPDAVAGIVGGIEQLAGRGTDLIIVGRGGGSLEELWPFNDELVARAIFASAVPVVSAVGHETDYTIADFVADRRAPTPSAAAEVAAPDMLDVSVRLGIAAGTMESVISERLRAAREQIGAMTRGVARSAPAIDRERQRTDELSRRAHAATERRHREALAGTGNCVWRLKSLNPDATLERGYAIVQKGPRVVSSVAQVQPADELRIRLHDGTVGAQAAGGATTARPRRRRRSIDEAQAPLFTMPEERV